MYGKKPFGVLENLSPERMLLAEVAFALLCFCWVGFAWGSILIGLRKGREGGREGGGGGCTAQHKKANLCEMLGTFYDLRFHMSPELGTFPVAVAYLLLTREVKLEMIKFRCRVRVGRGGGRTGRSLWPADYLLPCPLGLDSSH